MHMIKHWLSDDLRLRIRKVFEPRYGRQLTDDQVEEIAENLVGFTQTALNNAKIYGYEKSIQN